MIDALKDDTIVEKVGGRFKLCCLIQRRVVQLMEGARPLVEREGKSNLEIAVQEILEDKITTEYAKEPLLSSMRQPSFGRDDDRD